MTKRLKYLVGGEWKDTTSGVYYEITNSSTGEVMAEAPRCTADEVDAAVEAAAAAFPGWRDTPITKRVQVMFHLKGLMEENLQDIAMLLATEMGKSYTEARGDVLKAIEVVELACAAPVTMMGDSLMNVATGYDTVTFREPMGVFAGIVPWNFPAMIPMGWMMPLAVVTGNTFVLKAASYVPQTAMRMAELLEEAGLPPGVFNLVTCSRHEAERLLEHPKVQGVSFVGSTKVGRHIYATAAANGKRVQALTEAKNHALVMHDAPIRATAQRIINSAFGCAGERCMALPAIAVEESIADELVATITELAQERTIGPAYEETTDMGPLVNAEHFAFVNEWIEKSIQEGAVPVLDGRGVTVEGYEDGFYMGPTVFDHVTPGMSCGNQEVFGPVLYVKRVANFDEGVELINSSEFANGASIFTQSGHYAREFARRIDAGMVGVNVGIPVPISVFPFSGHKNSFFGDLHVMGRDGVMFYTETKAVTSFWFDEEAMKGDKVGTWEGTISRS
ncbi:MAG: CoA-acylating methylmalonate-semialdehyde dehydrogenase [Acidimicrobiia bacterium]|nr:CoA-acylating methylmalonate-semialdehyde dehydrogenase [Acidimicrobiia bacterium]MDX2467183.1 CoA-acylating methylmalonate-semialdehyde dehydrogenase [Acidimicrobiia bacterium]